MVGVVLPDCGGRWVPDTGGEGGGTLPGAVVKQLTDHGQNGIVVSGLVAWIEVQIDSQGPEVWRPLAERNWLEGEVTAAKDAIKAVCGQELLTLYPDFKTNRQGANKKIKEIETHKALETNKCLEERLFQITEQEKNIQMPKRVERNQLKVKI